MLVDIEARHGFPFRAVQASCPAGLDKSKYGARIKQITKYGLTKNRLPDDKADGTKQARATTQAGSREIENPPYSFLKVFFAPGRPMVSSASEINET
jgi:hypothetical protein